MLMFNYRTYQAAFLMALVGVQQNRPNYVIEAKQLAKDYLKFGVHPDGYTGDFERWRPDYPDLGWKYSCQCLASALLIADVIARTGDTELYQYVTSRGWGGTQGGHKNLLFAMNSLMKYQDGSFERYGTDLGSDLKKKLEHNIRQFKSGSRCFQ